MIWDRLREIADRAERESKQALSEEAERILAEYREARLDDPLDVIVRVPKPTPWQHEALKLIASGAVRHGRVNGPWEEFLARTKPKSQMPLSELDEEMVELGQYFLEDWYMEKKLNRLGLAVLAHLEESD